MDFYQKLDFANSSQLMLKQSLLDLLYQAQVNIAKANSCAEVDYKFAFTLEGKPIHSMMDIHQNCRIILISSSDHFEGIDTSQLASLPQTVHTIKPEPSSWVNHAVSQWHKHNQSTSSLSQFSRTFVTKAKNTFQSQVLNSVIDEHLRVHREDL